MGFFFFSSRRRHTRCSRDWSSDVCSSDLESELSIRGSRGAPAAWRTREEALLHEEGLVHFLERARILTHGGGDGGEPDRSSLELLDDGLQDPAVHVVGPELVHVEPLQRLGG